MSTNPAMLTATGHWPAILHAAGVPDRFLTGKHGPCPFCGGKDRFRFTDYQQRGGFICSQCNADGCDGLSFLMQWRGDDFKQALSWLEDYLRLPSSALAVDRQAVSVASGPTINELEERNQRMHKLFQQSVALTGDCLGSRYLQARSVWSDANKQPRREAVQTLRGIARHKGEELAVWLRCGIASDGAYVVDLCQPDNSNAVVVHPGNWDLVAVPPVRFVRNPDSLPLPEPTKGGDLSPLWRVVNIPEDMRSLVLAWLLESFRPDTPFPVLELIGEEGTAKSTTQNALRNLIDPNRVNLRAAPRNREDLCTSAAVNWLVSYENLSHLNPDLQDALCTVATGGGFATRKLYTTGEETTLKFKRPVILNGISAVVTQQDLLGRAVSLELPRIVMRQDDSETQATFKNNHAQMLGAVFDLLASTLAELPSIHIDPKNKPRMADFCRLGMAMEKASGGDPLHFHTRYAEEHRNSIQRTIDSSPVAAAIMALLEIEPFGITAPPAKILERLTDHRPDRCDSWPRSGKGLADALRRLSPAFSKLGVEIRKRDDLPRRDGNQWEIGVSKTPKATSPTSPCSHNRAIREVGERGEHDSRVYDTPPMSITSNREEF